MIIGCPSCVINNCFKGHLLNYWLDFDQLGRNDPYIALFKNCSNGSGAMRIKVTQAKNRFLR